MTSLATSITDLIKTYSGVPNEVPINSSRVQVKLIRALTHIINLCENNKNSLSYYYSSPEIYKILVFSFSLLKYWYILS